MTDEWETPQELFNKLNLEFQFTLDACASDSNHKLEKYYTMEEDSYYQSWENERVFMNPPYSEIDKWVRKAHLEHRNNNCPLIVALLPAWTDRIWFHQWVYERKTEIRFLKGRVKFLLDGLPKTSPRFGSMVVIWE